MDTLVSGQAAGGTRLFPDELLHAINAGREALFREHGFIETDAILRDLRDNGAR